MKRKLSPAVARERTRCTRHADQLADLYHDLAEKSHAKHDMNHWSACLVRAAALREVAAMIRKGTRARRTLKEVRP